MLHCLDHILHDTCWSSPFFSPCTLRPWCTWRSTHLSTWRLTSLQRWMFVGLGKFDLFTLNIYPLTATQLGMFMLVCNSAMVIVGYFKTCLFSIPDRVLLIFLTAPEPFLWGGMKNLGKFLVFTTRWSVDDLCLPSHLAISYAETPSSFQARICVFSSIFNILSFMHFPSNFAKYNN